MKRVYAGFVAGLWACVVPVVAFSAPESGSQWRVTGVCHEAVNLNGVACNGHGRLVAVGDSGTVRVSDDGGETWTWRQSGVQLDLKSVTWTGNQFVAVGGASGGGSVVIHSADGDEWSAVKILGGGLLVGVAGTSGRVVSVEDYGAVAVSDSADLDQWVWRHPGGSFLTSVCVRAKSGGEFVAVGSSGNVLKSSDGVHWDVKSLEEIDRIEDVATTATTMVVVGENFVHIAGFSIPVGAAMYSTDGGETWEEASGLEDIGYLYVVAATPNRFVAGGANGAIACSFDGVTWEGGYGIPGAGTAAVRGLCWTGERMVAVGDGGLIAYAETPAPESQDDWTIVEAPQEPSASGGCSGVAAGKVVIGFKPMPGGGSIPIYGDRVLAVCGGRTMVSVDGDEWEPGADAPAGGSFMDVAAMEPGFLAAGVNGLVAFGDGVDDWETRSVPTSETLFGIGWFPAEKTLLDHDLGVAVGRSGTIITTADGWSWALRDTPVSTNLVDVAVGKARSFVPVPFPGHWTENAVVMVVGSEGAVLRSGDGGEHWEEFTDGLPDVGGLAFHAVAAHGTVFVAVGGGGLIARVDLTYSNAVVGDSPQWVIVPSGTAEGLEEVVWTGSQWVAMGADGTILTSPDGTEWSAQDMGIEGYMHALTVAGDDGRLVAVGAPCVLAVSDPVPSFADWLVAQGVPAGQRGTEDDPNGDGASNLLACALGIPATGPTGSEAPAAMPRLVDPAPNGPVVVRFRVNPSPVRDVKLVVEKSEDLSSWTPVAEVMNGMGHVEQVPGDVLALSGGVATLTLSETYGDHARYFLRLRAERVP